MADEVMTMPEAAAYLKIHLATLKRWIQQGVIPVAKIGRRVLVRKQAVDEALRQHEQRRHPPPHQRRSRSPDVPRHDRSMPHDPDLAGAVEPGSSHGAGGPLDVVVSGEHIRGGRPGAALDDEGGTPSLQFGAGADHDRPILWAECREWAAA